MTIEKKLKKYDYVTFNISLSNIQGDCQGTFVSLGAQQTHLSESTGTFTKSSNAIPNQHTTKTQRNFIWLPWVSGSINEVATQGMDVITGPMSGCIVTRYNRGGAVYVGHLGTDIANPAADRLVKTTWNAFARQPASSVTGFNPLDGWPTDDYPKPKLSKNEGKIEIFALVTSTGAFYTFACWSVNDISKQSTKRIAEFKKVAPTPLTTLQAL